VSLAVLQKQNVGRAIALATAGCLLFNVFSIFATEPDHGLRVEHDATNAQFRLTWPSVAGRTYFIQHSTDLLQAWNWLPIIEPGNGETKEWAFIPTSEKGFWQLKSSDLPTADPQGDDFDGDGHTNLSEVEQGSDPLDYFSQPGRSIEPQMVIHKGNNQLGLPNNWLDVAFEVFVKDEEGNALVNAPVSFEILNLPGDNYDGLIYSAAAGNPTFPKIHLKTEPNGWSWAAYRVAATGNGRAIIRASTGVGQFEAYKDFVVYVGDNDNDLMPNRWEVDYGLDPEEDDRETDADEDGVSAVEEFTLTSNPSSADSNGNGIADGDEDSDGDGIPNIYELIYGLDPNQANDAPVWPTGMTVTFLESWQGSFFYPAGTNIDHPFGDYQGPAHIPPPPILFTTGGNLGRSQATTERNGPESSHTITYYNYNRNKVDHYSNLFNINEPVGQIIPISVSGRVRNVEMDAYLSQFGDVTPVPGYKIGLSFPFQSVTDMTLVPKLMLLRDAALDEYEDYQILGYGWQVDLNPHFQIQVQSTGIESVHFEGKALLVDAIPVADVNGDGLIQRLEPNRDHTSRTRRWAPGWTPGTRYPVELHPRSLFFMIQQEKIYLGLRLYTADNAPEGLQNPSFRIYPSATTTDPISNTAGSVLNSSNDFIALPDTLWPTNGGPLTVYVEPLESGMGSLYLSAYHRNSEPGQEMMDALPLHFLIFPMDIAVDANRDGVIKFAGTPEGVGVGKPVDKTQQSMPFSFWLNGDDDSNEVDNPDSSNHDYSDGAIQSERDLEDFARLHLYIGGLHEAIRNGQILVGLKWKSYSGEPQVKVYQAWDPNGTDSYLTNEGMAIAQTNGGNENVIATVDAGSTVALPTSIFADLDEGYEFVPFLFEAAGEGGKGQLTIVLIKDGQEIGEGPGVWLDLKDIKKMYVRSSTDNQFGQAPWDESDDTIIFVHGWRMSPSGRSEYAETFYKRLWHRGFKGRYAAFQWETHWNEDHHFWAQYIGPIDAYLSRYNDSEHIAWQSAAALKTFVNDLPGQTKHIAAHSMGNIVTSEAIRLGMNVNNYALMQAAVPSAAYDEHERTRVTSTEHYGATLLSHPLGFTVWDKQTPDDDPDAITRALAYRGRFTHPNLMNVNLVSFYLPQDYATKMPWEINNDQTKPEDGSLAEQYRYIRSNTDGQKLYKYKLQNDGGYPANIIQVVDYYLTDDPYEAMPYACSTWGKAQGAQNSALGSIDGNVPLNTSVFQLPGQPANQGFGDQHSGQFNANIQYLKAFYNELLRVFDIERNP
jgi:hypothetical protein